MVSESPTRERLAAGLHALDCTRCHRGAYCGGITEDDLRRADLLMDDVVTDLLAARTQALEAEVQLRGALADNEAAYVRCNARAARAEAEVERLTTDLQQLIDHSWAQYSASDYTETVSLDDVANRLKAILDGAS